MRSAGIQRKGKIAEHRKCPCAGLIRRALARPARPDHSLRIGKLVVFVCGNEFEGQRGVSWGAPGFQGTRGDLRNFVVSENRIQAGGQQKRVGDIRGEPRTIYPKVSYEPF